MAKFHFTMKDGEHFREADFEIPDKMLLPSAPDIFMKKYENPNELKKYRHGVISQHIRKWALAHIDLNWREIPDEQSQQGNANRTDHGTTE